MSEQSSDLQLTLGTPATYRITISGTLGESWCDQMDDLHIENTLGSGTPAQTTLTGQLADQSALLGVLNRLYGLGFSLRTVECLTTAKMDGVDQQE